jgi:hypothetical protein
MGRLSLSNDSAVVLAEMDGVDLFEVETGGWSWRIADPQAGLAIESTGYYSSKSDAARDYLRFDEEFRNEQARR